MLGRLSFIVPMSLLGDAQAANLRKMLLEETGLISVEAFPQKDNPMSRVFPEAKLSTAVFVTQNNPNGRDFRIRTHPGRVIEDKSPVVRILPKRLASEARMP